MNIIKTMKLRQLIKERELIKANRDAWVNKFRHTQIDHEIARTFKAYQNAINSINISIGNLRD